MSWLIDRAFYITPSIKQNKWLEYRNSLNRPLISAHRGGSELNPENTEMAFDYIVNNFNNPYFHIEQSELIGEIYQLFENIGLSKKVGDE